MTPLKPSEKRLLTIFGVAAFILLNLLGFSWYKKRNLALQSQRITLENRVRELEFMKTMAPEAEVKRAYLDQHLQAYPDEAARETYLDQFVQKEAGDLDLEVRKNQPMPPKLDELFHKSRYQAEVTGDWDNVLEFIFRLQSPKAFRFVPSIRLKSQKKEGSTDEAANVVCTFEIEKWWSPESVMPEDLLDPASEANPADAPSPDDPAPLESAAPEATSLPKTAATEQTPAPEVK
jgi:hypothetical protein